MSITVVTGWDATHSNLPHAPRTGQGAGYTTGSAGIAWLPPDWVSHPGAVRIDQDAGASDGTADVLDVENGAATPSECPGWVLKARASFNAGTRKGQREPAIYVNESNIHLVATALADAKITGVGLWVANWSLSQAQAEFMVANASGPYPVVAVQYSDQGGGGTFDLDVFSKNWLDKVSGATPPPAKGPVWNEIPDGYGHSLEHWVQARNGDFNTIVALSRANLNALHLAMLNTYLAYDAACVAAGKPHPPADRLDVYTVN